MLDPSDAVRMITRSPTSFSPAQRDYDIIPKRHNNRTLVLCFDGTGDKFDSDVRNPSSTHAPTTLTQPRLRVLIELQHCTLYITTKEGQQE